MAIVLPVVLVISKIFSFFSLISSATDTINQSQPLADGSTLVSSGGTFELGFFNPGNSPYRYVGLWYKNIPVRIVVWVANRNNPIRDNASKLIISQDGNLVLLKQNQTLLWSANVTRKAASPIVQLLENGNLVLRDGKDDDNNNSEQSFLWQSFDHPSDTILPAVKFRWDRKNAINNSLSAWKNWDDPSTGNLTYGIVHGNNPVMMMWKGFKPFCRLGPWNGISLSGSVSMKNNPLYNYKIVNNEDEVSSMYTLKNSSMVSIIVLNQTLYRAQWLTWVPLTRTWTEYLSWPQDKCDEYNFCGAYANCIPGAWPKCHCLDGFEPKSPQNWNAMDWTQGCVRNDTWSCGVKNRDGFRRFARMKLPETLHSWVDASMTLEDCQIKCLENCSCTAYANLDIRGAGSGCAIWFDDLNDMRVIENGQDLYVRMVTSDADDVSADAKQGHTRKLVLAVTITVVLVLSTLPFSYWRRTKYRAGKSLSAKKKDVGEQEDFELPFFDITTIINATNNFSNDNKLGKGGFGPVYKGTLLDGQEIAVKRLSSSSNQGVNEFKNEVILCAKLQHRNLVKVLGYCLEGEEKILLYEYMPNKSLDSFIFDSTRSILLDWSKRCHILHGIARGLLYLHQDSRLRIIHRDLKASNILLDNDMNPKISDFGLARMCRGDQIEGNTSRVVGTFGYMAPEYLKNGLFSTKSDVFSFGVLLLEIISGKRNKGSAYPSNIHNLIGHAWGLWKDGIPEDFIDANFRDSCNLSDVVHCIQIGLLCVQHHLNDRPNMTSVVVMLSREQSLPQPKEPTGFLTEIVSHERKNSSMKQASSNNEETMSLLSPR